MLTRAACVRLRTAMPSERNPTQIVGLHLYEMANSQTYRNRKETGGCQALGGGWGVIANGRGDLLEDGNLLKADMMVVQLCTFAKKSLNLELCPQHRVLLP